MRGSIDGAEMQREREDLARRARGATLAWASHGSRMPIAYSAITDGATFLLDEFGVCRRVLLKHAPHGQHTMGGRTRSQAARVVVGAQYVASIDTRVAGGLVPMPKAGAAMLFAYTGDDGRFAVVRTGPLVKFETLTRPVADDTLQDLDADDDCMTVPLHESGERATPVSLLVDDTWGPSEPPRRESLPTLRLVDPPAPRGVLPKRAGRW